MHCLAILLACGVLGTWHLLTHDKNLIFFFVNGSTNGDMALHSVLKILQSMRHPAEGTGNTLRIL